ncbi:MAG: ATP-binding cassette domain-containing protein [Deltaproteobacteria bacterium]|nr:ATP-binding cassette domain-containing protein [Deltaproteobacteria bacterium]
MSICLTAESLTVAREKNGMRFTLHVPHLDVRLGQTLAIFGPSGCGKSTLLDILALVLRPTSAETFCFQGSKSCKNLLVLNQYSLAEVRGHDIGYVLQSGGLLPFLSVLDNILLPARLVGMRMEETRKRAYDLCDKLDISAQLDKKPQHLSGGQRQRVAIARALIHRPVLVLADEPTAAVDSSTAEDICAVFTSMANDYGVAMVIVSHDQPLMSRYADRTVGFDLKRLAVNDIHSTLQAAR